MPLSLLNPASRSFTIPFSLSLSGRKAIASVAERIFSQRAVRYAFGTWFWRHYEDHELFLWWIAARAVHVCWPSKRFLRQRECFDAAVSKVYGITVYRSLFAVGIYIFYVCIVIYLFGDLAIYATAVPKSLRDVVWYIFYSSVWAIVIPLSLIFQYIFQ